ncbi:MAG: diguanylate cyclase [Thermoanaerobaculia bacterium]
MRLTRRSPGAIVGTFAALTIVPTIVLAFGISRLSTDTMRHEVEQRLESTASASALFVSQYFQGLKELCVSYAARPRVVAAMSAGRPDGVKLMAHLDELGNSRAGIAAAFVASPEGTVLAITPATPEVLAVNFAHRDWYKGVISTKRPYVSEVFISRARGNPRVVGIATPIWATQESKPRLVGILVLAFGTLSMQTFVDEFSNAQRVHLSITDQRGILVADAGRPPLDLTSQIRDEPVARSLRGEKGILEEGSGADQAMTAYSAIFPLGWSLTARVVSETAFAPVRRLHRQVLLLAFFILTTVAIGLLFLRQSLIERQRAESKLHRNVVALEESSREIDILGRTATLLQSAIDSQEAFEILQQAAVRLFEGDSGALCVLNTAKNLVEEVASFGDSNGRRSTYPPQDCWALRGGRVHATADGVSPVCPHLAHAFRGSLCVPMSAQHESIGVFWLANSAISDSRRRLATAFAEQASLAIANLRLRESLRSQAIRDPLTGLFNRRYLEEFFDREVRRAARKNTSVGVLMLDVDLFKQFNDSHGHTAGDAALKAIAGTILSICRAEDIACRFGGEEFAVILPEASLEKAFEKAESIVRAVRGAVLSEAGIELPGVTISIGVAAFPEHGDNLASILGVADRALYLAKGRGRDRAVCSDERLFAPLRLARDLPAGGLLGS